jgi:hypothetical protein
MQLTRELIDLVEMWGVAAAACAFLVAVVSEIFAVEVTSMREPGFGEPIYVPKYIGPMARLCRWMTISLLAFIASACTTVLAGAIINAVIAPEFFSPSTLVRFSTPLLLVAFVCILWTALLVTLLRWKRLRITQAIQTLDRVVENQERQLNEAIDDHRERLTESREWARRKLF